MNRGIHSRGYLPHWDFEKSVQAITFRLADSVPSKVIKAWKLELATIPDDKQRSKQLHRLIAEYEDTGHGDAILANVACASIVQKHLTQDHGVSYKLIAWVIMPNHIHVMIRLFDGHSLTPVVQRWKGASAVHINRHLNRSGKLWESDYYDRFIRDMDHYHDSIAYISNNPVKAGLCEKPEDWRFSSAGISWSADFSPPESPSNVHAD
jgi:REP element-mobilizing transposase RayT